MPRAVAPNEQCSGRTLPELLIALTVSGILCALLTTAFLGHQRLTAGTTAIAELRAQQRQAQEIFSAFLRAASTSDFYALHDTLADFDYTIASAVACLDTPPAYAILAPDSLTSGQRFASWTHTPQPGDLAHIFDPGLSAGPADDTWWTAAVSGLARAPNACATSPLLDSLTRSAHQASAVGLTWPGGSAPATIPTGAVVRFTRRVRAFLYASSGRHHLGVSDFDPTTSRWTVVQPVSGSYANARAAPGIELRALDSLGNAATTPSTLSLTVRSQTATRLRIPGMRQAVRGESLATHIALRNR